LIPITVYKLNELLLHPSTQPSFTHLIKKRTIARFINLENGKKVLVTHLDLFNKWIHKNGKISNLMC